MTYLTTDIMHICQLADVPFERVWQQARQKFEQEEAAAFPCVEATSAVEHASVADSDVVTVIYETIDSYDAEIIRSVLQKAVITDRVAENVVAAEHGWWFPEDEKDKGKPAITHYKVIERLYYVSLVECQLETGRTHQIRVHMKSQGHPLFSDTRYGGSHIVKGTVFSKYRQFVENCFKLMSRQALHAKSLGFTHPRTGERMYFEAELPDDFQAVLNKWRGYLHGRKEKIQREQDEA